MRQKFLCHGACLQSPACSYMIHVSSFGPLGPKCIYSRKLTWKPKKGPIKTTVLLKGGYMGFHVSLGECISYCMATWTRLECKASAKVIVAKWSCPKGACSYVVHTWVLSGWFPYNYLCAQVCTLNPKPFIATWNLWVSVGLSLLRCCPRVADYKDPPSILKCGVWGLGSGFSV